MNEFISSIVASLLATIIAAIFAFFFRKKLGSLVKRWLISVFDMGTYNIFSNDTDDEYLNDLKEELIKAKFIHMFAGRGRFLFEEPYRTILEKQNIEIKILLPDVKNDYDIDWIETALDKIAPHESFRKQVSASVEYILSLCKKSSKIMLREYHALAVGRITITDYVAYFQPYTKDFSDKSPIYKYKSGSFMYMWAVRYFDSYWEPKHIDVVGVSENNT
jgi:hypothetical protein